MSTWRGATSSCRRRLLICCHSCGVPQAGAIRSLLLHVRGDSLAEGAVQIQLVDLHLNEHLAGSHVELPQEVVDLLPFLRCALNQQGVVERVGYDVWDSLSVDARSHSGRSQKRAGQI